VTFLRSHSSNTDELSISVDPPFLRVASMPALDCDVLVEAALPVLATLAHVGLRERDLDLDLPTSALSMSGQL
jgi:hypothetical protein